VPDPVAEIVDVNGKTQLVRLLDVFVLGPLMIYIAARYKIHEPQRTTLLVSGVLTIIYNGVNYINIRNAAQIEKESNAA
jgi:hypothetical protein